MKPTINGSAKIAVWHRNTLAPAKESRKNAMVLLLAAELRSAPDARFWIAYLLRPLNLYNTALSRVDTAQARGAIQTHCPELVKQNKRNEKHSESNRRNKQNLVVVIQASGMDGTRNHPPSSLTDLIVTASSQEEAENLAVGERNLIGGYNPEEDGGFIAVHAYTRAELQTLLDSMAESD